MVILLILILHISKRYNGLRLICLALQNCLICTLAPLLTMFIAKALINLLRLWHPFLIRPLSFLFAVFPTAFLLIGDIIIHLGARLPYIA